MTAPARLGLLLPWLNGAFDEHHFEGRNPEPVAVWTDYPAIRRVLAAFVKSFDGSAEAGHLEVVDDPTPAYFRQQLKEPTDDELGELEAYLDILLEQGFAATAANLFLPATSLRFAVRSAGRQKPAKRGSIIAGGAAALRNYRAPGAYVLQMHGPTLELVPFLVAQLLTAPNMASVKRCERQGCAHFVITATAKRGRPQQFCSKSCRELNAEQLEQRVRKKR